MSGQRLVCRYAGIVTSFVVVSMVLQVISCRPEQTGRQEVTQFFEAVKGRNYAVMFDSIDPTLLRANNLDIEKAKGYIEAMIGPLPANVSDVTWSFVNPPKNFGTEAWSEDWQIVVDVSQSGNSVPFCTLIFKRSEDGWKADVFELCSRLSSQHGDLRERMRRLGTAMDRAGIRELKKPDNRLKVTRDSVRKVEAGQLDISKAYESY